MNATHRSPLKLVKQSVGWNNAKEQICNQCTSRLCRYLWFTYESGGIFPKSSAVARSRFLDSVAITNISMQLALLYNELDYFTYNLTSRHGTGYTFTWPRPTVEPVWTPTKEECTMALIGSSVLASTQSAVSVPTNMTTLGSATPTSGVTTLGFVISLCIMKQCLRYDYHNIKAVNFYRNYNIIKIPTNAFLGATYLKVSWHSIRHNFKYTCVRQ